MENLDERIKEAMASVFGVDAATLNEDTTQDDIAEWDSLKHLDLIVALEDEFGVTIPLEEVGNMTNFKYIRLTLQELL
jgi:acyl carrier protein